MTKYTIKTLNENGAQYFSFFGDMNRPVFDSYHMNAKFFSTSKEAAKTVNILRKTIMTPLTIVSEN